MFSAPGFGLKTDENGQKNTYHVFTFTFFCQMEMKTGMTETETDIYG
jgi:hypothetical protein